MVFLLSKILHRNKDKPLLTRGTTSQPQRPLITPIPKSSLVSSALSSVLLPRRLMSIKRNGLTSRRSSLLKRQNSTSTNKMAIDCDDGMLFENLSDEGLVSLSIHNDPGDTFDNHHVHEAVRFPSLGLNIPTVMGETPLGGLTYELFLFPDYMKMYRRHKHLPRIPDLFLAQELLSTPIEADLESLSSSLLSDEVNNPHEVLVMEFSRDGQYLAAAGRDNTLRVWKVLLSPLGRLEHRNSSVPNLKDVSYNSAPVFHSRPVAVFKGHTSTIISLDWSKNNFLLTGSMDKTAKLWHVDRPKCLQSFQLQDFVTAVKFHPTDDRFFALGSIDNKLILWLILEGTVSYERFLDDNMMITTLSFTPDGEHIMVGGFNGTLVLTETKGLETIAMVEITEKLLVKLGGAQHGKKITGIEVFPPDKPSQSSDPVLKWNVLITTNDSKIRLVQDKKLVTRFKGLHNLCSSIKGRTLDDRKYIILGLEDHQVYIWQNDNSIINNKIRQTLREFVTDGKNLHDRHMKHRKLYTKLVKDNVFMRKLIREDERFQHANYVANENNSYTSFHPFHLRVNVALFAPEKTKQLLELSDDIIYDLFKRGLLCNFENPLNSLESPYQETPIPDRGAIIVATDQCGTIRVYRQDIAYNSRKQFIDLYKRCQQSQDDSFLIPASSTTCDQATNIRKSFSLRSRLPDIHRRFSHRHRSRSNALATQSALPSPPLFPQTRGILSPYRDGSPLGSQASSQECLLPMKQGAATIEQRFSSYNRTRSPVPIIVSNESYFPGDNKVGAA